MKPQQRRNTLPELAAIPSKLELGGPKQGRLSIRLHTADALPRECLLTDAMFEILLVLVRSVLSDEYAVVDLLPIAGGSKPACFKLIERLRNAVGDDDHSLIVWDKATLYHLATHVTYSKDFALCRKLYQPSSMIDEIIRLIDGRSMNSRS